MRVAHPPVVRPSLWSYRETNRPALPTLYEVDWEDESDGEDEDVEMSIQSSPAYDPAAHSILHRLKALRAAATERSGDVFSPSYSTRSGSCCSVSVLVYSHSFVPNLRLRLLARVK